MPAVQLKGQVTEVVVKVAHEAVETGRFFHLHEACCKGGCCCREGVLLWKKAVQSSTRERTMVGAEDGVVLEGGVFKGTQSHHCITHVLHTPHHTHILGKPCFSAILYDNHYNNDKDSRGRGGWAR